MPAFLYSLSQRRNQYLIIITKRLQSGFYHFLSCAIFLIEYDMNHVIHILCPKFMVRLSFEEPSSLEKTRFWDSGFYEEILKLG